MGEQFRTTGGHTEQLWKSVYPHQGGKYVDCEAEGGAGAKEGMPGTLAAGGSEGEYNTAAQAENAAQHQRPAVQADPSNITGSIDDYAESPTKGEGSTAPPVNY